MADYKIKVGIQVLKPVQEVFQAIIQPHLMVNYFISKGSDVLEEGKQIMWAFPEFEGEFPINVIKVEDNTQVSFAWEVDEEEHVVNILLQHEGKNATVVLVTEEPKDPSIKNIKWLKSNTEGWANFLACLKAYLEYNINLRKGAFNYMKK